MLSLVAGAMLFVASSLVGAGCRRYYLRRKKVMAELDDFVSFASAEVRLKTGVEDVYRSFCIGKEGYVCEVFDILIDFTLHRRSPKELRLPYLKTGENTSIAARLIQLGSEGLQGESNRLNALRELTSEAAKRAAEEYETNGKLSFKLGVLVGIAAMILVA